MHLLSGNFAASSDPSPLIRAEQTKFRFIIVYNNNAKPAPDNAWQNYFLIPAAFNSGAALPVTH